MKFTEVCIQCGNEFIPKRRGVQKFCSNSCRSRNWQLKNVKKQKLPTNNEVLPPPNITNKTNEGISWSGFGNAALGTATVDLAKHYLTPEPKRNATKEDIRKLYSLIKGQRYLPVKNIPDDPFGRKPYYDIETGNIEFFIPEFVNDIMKNNH
ncbi:hypothetical protein [Winogradskyella tangerina]|uniref:hypothetical protein n=1 Tax=Winogradskyella tangerina TaxID=2023240 RepID=UPI000DBE04A5|nr:hypothetical protein [Winogradskyella tangerina]